MLNIIWLAMLVVAVLVAGFTGKLPELTKGAFETAETAVMKIALPLVGVMAIWLGMMRLAEQAGVVQLIARALRPLLRRLFPDVPPDHPAMGAMVMNMAANMLGLGNAATPLGLRAMALLDKLNPRPGVASNAMVTFLAINTASIQLIPTTAISLLAIAGAKDPTAIVPSAILATICAFTCGVAMAKLLERTPWFRLPPLPAPAAAAGSERAGARPSEAEETDVEKIEPRPLNLGGKIILPAFFAFFVFLFLAVAFPDSINWSVALANHVRGWFGLNPTWSLPPSPADFAEKSAVMRALLTFALLAVPFLLTFFPLYATLRGVKVYSEFAEGAKSAFDVGVRIVPYLVAMLVAVRMLREAGVVQWLTDGLKPVLGAIGFPPDLLPMVLMRPLSGSATQGLFVELINRTGPGFGPDSLISKMAATIYGSTETTFYVLAVYFGSVAIRQTRHAVLAGLTADTVAVIASVIFCTLLFR